MAVLNIPGRGKTMTEPGEIRFFLRKYGIWYDRWPQRDVPYEHVDRVIEAYADVLGPFMQKGGYLTADVIQISNDTPDYAAIRSKFLREHIHDEDEVRFFIGGKGYFWFNPSPVKEDIFNVCCESGDVISVPSGTPHWFDAGEYAPCVKAIRIFIDKTGWVPHYTESGAESIYPV